MLAWIVSGILFAAAVYGIVRIAKASGLFSDYKPTSVAPKGGSVGSGPSAPASKPK